MNKATMTLEDVARASGLSRAQVSRALRGDPGVTAATRELVESAAREIGYRPNLAARALASAHSTSIGIVIGEPLNPFHMLLAQALDTRLAAIGYDAVVSLRTINDEAVLAESDRFLSMRARGVFLISTPQSDEAIGAFSRVIPCVYLGRQLPDLAVPAVSSDDEEATIRLVRHLINLGHRRIAHIQGGEKAGARERRSGYRRIMKQMQLPLIEIPGTHDIDSGRLGVELLLKDPTRPTAVFADNDLTAIGVINELNRRGLRVPHDIAVAGYDDIPASGSETIALTTLRQDPGAHAAAAIEALTSLLVDPIGEKRSHVVPSELVVRRSTSLDEN